MRRVDIMDIAMLSTSREDFENYQALERDRDARELVMNFT